MARTITKCRIRMKKMIAKLGELGMPVDFQTVADKTGGSLETSSC